MNVLDVVDYAHNNEFNVCGELITSNRKDYIVKTGWVNKKAKRQLIINKHRKYNLELDVVVHSSKKRKSRPNN